MWDYIIVGAGTAGCVAANGLTASGKHRVLLVEAGGRPTLAVKIPAGFAQLFNSPLDWAFESEPQSHCGDRVVFTPRGRMLGGSSNMNAQIHQWCHPADFDGWQSRGALGWGWNDVAPVFRQMETWTGQHADDRCRGRSGPMIVSPLASPGPLSRAFVAAAHSVGLDGPPDYNGVPYRGAWLTQLAHKNGARFSAYDAYLKPAMKRANLHVRPRAQVGRIVFDGRRAVGVELLDGPGERTLRATKGIVLAAGAFGSPQLLMLSGVGPAGALRALGITVLVDSGEIGANLQDHPISAVTWVTRRPVSHKSADRKRSFFGWLLLRRGLLASNVAEAMAFASVLDDAAPDLELIYLNAEWREQGLLPPREHAYTIGAAVVAPRSTGLVRLKTASPRDPPAIDFRLLSDPEGHDAAVMLAGARLARRIAAAEPLASETLRELLPGEDVRGDDELLAFLKSEVQTVYHPCGTCRMGNDPGVPVDPRLKLRGAEGLWVVDASVMPTVPRGHPNAVVAMIAQRGVEMILDDA